MTNKTLGKGLLTAIALLVITAIFETSLDYNTSENLYMVGGLMLFFFGIWGAINLIKS
jgi:uncharacterized membrane protein